MYFTFLKCEEGTRESKVRLQLLLSWVRGGSRSQHPGTTGSSGEKGINAGLCMLSLELSSGRGVLWRGTPLLNQQTLQMYFSAPTSRSPFSCILTRSPLKTAEWPSSCTSCAKHLLTPLGIFPTHSKLHCHSVARMNAAQWVAWSLSLVWTDCLRAAPP